ncbi:MAG: NADP-dependent malic enzyme [bacterium]
MSDTQQQSLEMHLQHHGKLSVKSKVKVTNKTELSLAYTPGVASPCLEIAKDKSKVYDYTFKKNTVAVVTDGSAVLGLGNIGPEAALPVMEGKALLFKEFADIDAWPICLDTQDVEEIIKTVKFIAPGFGGINLEDISAPRCFEIEERLKNELDIPVFHDDQHGTAVIVLAGLINALKVVNKNIVQVKILINGVGSAGVAIAKLLLFAGAENLLLADSKGAIYYGRDDLNDTKKDLALKTNLPHMNFNNVAGGFGDVAEPTRNVETHCNASLQSSGCCVRGNLREAIKGADVFIGVSKADLVDEEMVKSMNKNSIIFAMANPNPEIMPDLAKKAGAAVVATGRSDFENQLNNVLVFPGIFRGALDNNIKKITDNMKLNVAKVLAGLAENPTADKIIPDVFDKRVAGAVAGAVR